LTWQEALPLVGLGAAIVVVTSVFDGSFKLPGHTGLAWLALLMIGRTTSRYRWAAGVSSIGAAVVSTLPFWGFGDPLKWLIYLLVGLALDVMFNLAPRWQYNVLFLTVIAGLAHAIKPLMRVGISAATGMQYSSLLSGVLYPLAMHVFFGLLGGLLGAGMVWAFRRMTKH